MTQDEEAAMIKAVCARLGRPIPRTKTGLTALVLALEAEREGKNAPPQSPEKPSGRPSGLTVLGALLLSSNVSILGVEACKKICEEKRGMQQDINPETLRTKSSKLRNQRSKFIKDEKFKAKLLSDLEGTCYAVFDFVATHFDPSDQNLANVLLIDMCFNVVNEYLGDDASEAVAERILRALKSVEKESV